MSTSAPKRNGDISALILDMIVAAECIEVVDMHAITVYAVLLNVLILL